MNSIIIGFPCIGKGTVVKEDKSFIELKISDFINKSSDQPKYLFDAYCRTALDIAQTHNVFLSCTPEILELMNQPYDYIHSSIIVIYPALSLKDRWIKRMKSIYDNKYIDNKQEYEYVFENYDNIIKCIESYSYGKIEIASMNYASLIKIINSYKEMNSFGCRIK